MDEAVVAHVGPLAGAVDGEVAEDDDRQAVGFRVGPAQVLARQLGDSVGGDPGRLAVVSSPDGEAAVHRRGGGEEEALQPGGGAAQRLEQPVGSQHVTG